MTVTLLATLCHMATVGPTTAPIEFCQEQIIAPRLLPGYTVRSIRCAKGNETPRNAI